MPWTLNKNVIQGKFIKFFALIYLLIRYIKRLILLFLWWVWWLCLIFSQQDTNFLVQIHMIKKSKGIKGSSECIKVHSNSEGQKNPYEPFKTSNLIATVVRDGFCRLVIEGKSPKDILVEERVQHVVVTTLEIEHTPEYLVSGLFWRLSLTWLYWSHMYHSMIAVEHSLCWEKLSAYLKICSRTNDVMSVILAMSVSLHWYKMELSLSNCIFPQAFRISLREVILN